MAATIIRVKFDELAQIAQYFEEEGQLIQRLHRQTEDELDLLYREGWRSPAATRFYDTAYDSLLPSTANLGQALQQSAVTVRQIVIIMQNADEEGKSIILALLEILLTGATLPLYALAVADWSQIAKVSNSLFKKFVSDYPKVMSRYLIESGIDFGTNLFRGNADDLTNLGRKYRILELFDTGSGRLIKDVALPGVIDGLVDHTFNVLSGESDWHDTEAAGVQITSGMIQAGIMINPIGAKIMLADLTMQTMLTGFEFVAEPVADFLGYDGDRVGDAIRDFRELVSIDDHLDNAIEFIADGGIQEAAGNFLDGARDFFGFD